MLQGQCSTWSVCHFEVISEQCIATTRSILSITACWQALRWEWRDIGDDRSWQKLTHSHTHTSVQRASVVSFCPPNVGKHARSYRRISHNCNDMLFWNTRTHTRPVFLLIYPKCTYVCMYVCLYVCVCMYVAPGCNPHTPLPSTPHPLPPPPSDPLQLLQNFLNSMISLLRLFALASILKSLCLQISRYPIPFLRCYYLPFFACWVCEYLERYL